MSNFKAGDKVIFISENGEGDARTVKGKEYTVAHSDGIILWTVEGVACYANRFALSKDVPVDPLDFTNLERHTVSQLVATREALEQDIATKQATLNEAVAANQLFIESLGAYGLALIGQTQQAAPVSTNPLSGRLFNSLTFEEFYSLKKGDKLKFIGTTDEASDQFLSASFEDEFEIDEVDTDDHSVYLINARDTHWIWLNEGNPLDSLFEIV